MKHKEDYYLSPSQIIVVILFCLLPCYFILRGGVATYHDLTDPSPKEQLDSLVKWEVVYKGNDAHFVPTIKTKNK